ncbi:hypothetical protein AND_010662 [Anopheles darlingi]|uniref:Uncharacterized protein n=1 Tax=Anopheles darlingi TaxID=43151 RepID=W5J357_ANODA|nr:hypothetical protein AND_010662 [Anopheles darlingi]
MNNYIYDHVKYDAVLFADGSKLNRCDHHRFVISNNQRLDNARTGQAPLITLLYHVRTLSGRPSSFLDASSDFLLLHSRVKLQSKRTGKLSRVGESRPKQCNVQ